MAARTYYPRCRVVLDVLLEDFGDGSSGESHTYEVTPRTVEWTRNDLRTADEVRLELDYRDFPLDPRVVRSVAIAVYCGDIGAPDAALDLDDESMQVFFGQADEPQTTLGAAGETVTLEGRDHTAIFLAQEWRWGAVDIERDLGDIISEILAAIPAASGLSVELRANTGAGLTTTLSELTGKTKWTPQSGDDAWTVIVELCGLAGLVPVIDLDTLRILAPGDLTSAGEAAFLYGSNVGRLELRRRLVEERSKRIQLRAWDPQARKSREVLYPAEPLVTRRRIAADGSVVSDPEAVIPWTVVGSYTDAELEELAAAYFEELARPELQGILETRDMTDLEEGMALPILAQGDTITVELGTVRADLAGLSQSEAVELLSSGPEAMEEGAAEALVAVWTQAQDLATTFIVRQARHRWSRDEGYQLTVDFETYVGAES